jgi:hypothetical protein
VAKDAFCARSRVPTPTTTPTANSFAEYPPPDQPPQPPCGLHDDALLGGRPEAAPAPLRKPAVTGAPGSRDKRGLRGIPLQDKTIGAIWPTPSHNRYVRRTTSGEGRSRRPVDEAQAARRRTYAARRRAPRHLHPARAAHVRTSGQAGDRREEGRVGKDDTGRAVVARRAVYARPRCVPGYPGLGPCARPTPDGQRVLEPPSAQPGAYLLVWGEAI